MSFIFGGSKEKTSSSNRAYDTINSNFTPLMSNAGEGLNSLKALLSGDTSGFNAYKKATGFDAAAEAGSRGITGNAAASGLLRSGSTGKALQSFGNNLQNQYAGSFMDRLLQQAQLGFNAGNLLTSAGQVSEGSKSSKPGISKFLGGIMSGGAVG